MQHCYVYTYQSVNNALHVISFLPFPHSLPSQYKTQIPGCVVLTFLSPIQIKYQVPNRTQKAYFNTAHIFILHMLLLHYYVSVKNLSLTCSFRQY
jgi:hypothetical protein